MLNARQTPASSVECAIHHCKDAGGITVGGGRGEVLCRGDIFALGKEYGKSTIGIGDIVPE